MMPITPKTSINKSRMVVETGETGSNILRFSGGGIPPAVLAVAKQHSTMWGKIPKYTHAFL
jgi:hypothetical protein